MRELRLFASLFFISTSLFGQVELEIDFNTIETNVLNPNSDFYYPTLLDRYDKFDSTLSLQDYTYIYYGFAFHEDYLKNRPKEDVLSELLKKEKFEKLIIEGNKILEANPVSLKAIDKIGFAMYRLGKPKLEWNKYRNRYLQFRKVIAYSGDGLTCASAFKVIYISDEYLMIYDYFEIPEINLQALVGNCDEFEIESSEYFKASMIYFDISLRIHKQKKLMGYE